MPGKYREFSEVWLDSVPFSKTYDIGRTWVPIRRPAVVSNAKRLTDDIIVPSSIAR